MQRRNETWQARHQLHGAAFHWDLENASIRFEGGTRRVVADITVVGTVAESHGTFLWAWANTFPPRAMQGLDAVREFGRVNDLGLLTTAEWPGGRAELLEMIAVAGRILDGDGVFVDTLGDVTIGFVLRNFRENTHGEVMP
jgi:hypothetical protein